MRTDQPITVYRKDYQPPAYWVDQVELVFDLHPESTTVTASLTIRRNAASTLARDLVLDGESLELVSAEVDSAPADATVGEDGRLTVRHVPDAFTLRTVVRCNPSTNTTMSGLYLSSGYFFTQCEAEGFRRITFFPDRPDVMARYRVELRADRAQLPVLLSNGNLVDEGALTDGRHFAIWEDPFPKPCYLFALVAADLVCNEQRIKTLSGREVLLQVWVQDGNLDKTPHAMQSLVDSIHWDERRFGLELDLDRFMIVATSDFNMGAMENKGLNIFNTKYVLANPAIATDIDFANIESVVGHEYFHNWSGNRVTCRDWFQLSLKEGLTVFRDQEFSIDMLAEAAADPAAAASARAVKRIDDVRMLRSMQFPEDSGPMAHPIRPDAYQGIDNFYTVTIYEKGAEVVRMQQTLTGRDGFRRGIDEYFRRHDGQAVTCDDFVSAMEAANAPLDLTQFRRWYSQAGTPRVRVTRRHDAATGRYELTLSQHTPATPGQPGKQAFHIPISVGLLDADGRDLPLTIVGDDTPAATTRVLSLREATQTFVFEGIAEAPVPSVLRDFSAPVRLEHDLSDDECAFLLAHDSDAFNRWEAGQQLLMRSLLSHIEAGTLPTAAPTRVTAAFRQLLSSRLDPAFVEVVLSLPDESFIAEQLPVVDPVSVARTRTALAACLGKELGSEWRELHARLASAAPYSPDAASAGRRALRNRALAYLVDSGASDGIDIARQQYREAGNMTDRFAALTALANAGQAAEELEDFYRRFENEPLVIDKWFALQATSRLVPGGGRQHFVEHVVGLLKHAAFTLRNPNRARSVILQFCMNNPTHFHAADGMGYELWAEYTLKLDTLNPQVASRLARCMDRWRRYTADRQVKMQGALERVAGKPGLSKETSEIVTKALA